MTTLPVPAIPLPDGRTIPQLGLGVYKIPDDEAAACVRTALDAGYRHIDTAALYANERGVGQGLRTSGVPREDIFVTTKVWNDDHGYDETLRAFDASLGRLGTDYVDLYLVHWPIPSRDRYVETYRALESLRADGRARSIGVSNFAIAHLDRLLAETEVVPAVNQIELHPLLPQHELRAYGASHGIVTEAWSPLARGRLLDDPVLAAIARKHGRSTAQVIIRWHLQLGTVVIPKSVSPDRIRANADVFGFALDDDDLRAVAGLESDLRTGRDPSLD
ncbi:aldo/keto reductase [Microbacterium gilvum]|uniref:aldo/keto reductase n=1 Tax=Microbacterium gilvum TaxID=1336204 RepID=UPI0031EE85E4